MFTGDRLRVARQRRALTKKILAEKLAVSPRAVTAWEADEYPPEPDKLCRLSQILEFPLSFFELDEPVKTKTDAVSFRSLSSKTAKQRDAVLAMCDLAKDVAVWLGERFELPKADLPDLRGEDPALAASMLRHNWGLGVRPVKNMLHLLEAKGVRVFALAENAREVDACSFWSDSTPFVLLNTEMSSERIRFDMAHELGHLILHRHAAPSGRTAENEANRFASEFLMPEDSVRANRSRHWTIGSLIERKKIWNVSLSALAYRLNQLGYLSEWHFKSLNIEMVRRGYKYNEPDSSPHEQSKVWEVVLGRLREIGMPLSFVANQICMPESELRGLLYGLAKVSFSGSGGDGGDGHRAVHLKVVK